MVTGNREVAAGALAAGADAVLSKPFTAAEVCAAVALLLRDPPRARALAE